MFVILTNLSQTYCVSWKYFGVIFIYINYSPVAAVIGEEIHMTLCQHSLVFALVL